MIVRRGRLELVGESVRAALEELADADPGWLAPLIEPQWDERYGRKAEAGKLPGGKPAVVARAEEPGRDGQLRWREGTTLPPAPLRFGSSYDTDAHYCVKRDTGYRLARQQATCPQGAASWSGCRRAESVSGLVSVRGTARPDIAPSCIETALSSEPPGAVRWPGCPRAPG